MYLRFVDENPSEQEKLRRANHFLNIPSIVCVRALENENVSNTSRTHLEHIVVGVKKHGKKSTRSVYTVCCIRTYVCILSS